MKRLGNMNHLDSIFTFDSTYKELKLLFLIMLYNSRYAFDSTYKELKQEFYSFEILYGYFFWLYL